MRAALLLLPLGFAPALAAERAAVEAERAAVNARLKSSPTSYINLVDMTTLADGEERFVDLSVARGAARWLAAAPPAGARLRARRSGAEILLSYAEGAQVALSSANRSSALSNGLYAQLFNPGASRLMLGLHDPGNRRQRRFRGLAHYPHDRAAVVKGAFKPSPPKEVHFLTTLNKVSTGYLVGEMSFSYRGKALRLDAYSMHEPARSRLLFLPFRDANTGRATYGGGRYLSVEAPAGVLEGGELELDFNEAYNPLCAYTPFFNCVIVPGNKVAVAIEAGERAP